MIVGCETKQDWEVTTKSETQTWNTTSVKMIRTEISYSKETVLDMSEKEIKEYCQPSYYHEQYGTTLYKHFTTKTYVELK
ncbi:MAG: hypothetical protein ACRCV7_00060 [Culicoidibacterales bacterium]